MIRHAEVKDIDQILALLDEVNLIHATARPDIFNKVSKYSSKDLEQKIKLEPIFVYEEDNIIKGYIFSVLTNPKSRLIKDNPTLFIDDFCVKNTERGKHIGTKLYEYVKEYARTNNIKRITLNVWSFNESAYKFYLKCGLKPLEMTMEEVL